MFTFRRPYFLWAVFLFIVEVLIAVLLNDRFIRPTLGDYLVVILLYCFVRAFLKLSPLKIAIGVLIFAFIVETTQYFHLIVALGWEKSKVAKAFIGGSFDWFDIIAYTLGIMTVLIIENY